MRRRALRGVMLRLSLRRRAHFHIDVEKLARGLPSVFTLIPASEIGVGSRNAKRNNGPRFRNPLKLFLTQVTCNECAVRRVANGHTVDREDLIVCHRILSGEASQCAHPRFASSTLCSLACRNAGS
jgi:hypothetical protein